MALLELHNLTKSFGRPAVREVSLSLDHGDVLCLLGPSGCGKTTLLRMIAGLETPDHGRVFFDGADVTDLPPQKRNFGLMFQEFALFPHKNVRDNIAFGLEMQQASPREQADRTGEMMALMGIADLAGRDVASLSGGERQRVALARSLAPRPRLLMLDEPLGALDRALRERLLVEIRTILKQLAITAVFVTHDQSEALAGADRIGVMNRGRLEQVDSPERLYFKPRTEFTARFLGFRNLVPGRIAADGAIETDLGRFRPDALPESTAQADQTDNQATLVIRPEAARLGQGRNDETTIAGRVERRLFTGRGYQVELIAQPGDRELVFDLANDNPPPAVGESIELAVNPAGLAVIVAKDREAGA